MLEFNQASQNVCGVVHKHVLSTQAKANVTYILYASSNQPKQKLGPVLGQEEHTSFCLIMPLGNTRKPIRDS